MTTSRADRFVRHLVFALRLVTVSAIGILLFASPLAIAAWTATCLASGAVCFRLARGRSLLWGPLLTGGGLCLLMAFTSALATTAADETELLRGPTVHCSTDSGC